MIVRETPLSGVVLLEPQRHGDDRGFFSESWNKARMDEAGLAYDFVQDNHSMSTEVGTLRGLHYQAPPHAQAKLVRCGRGRLFDVVVDVRKGSPTYGDWYGAELSFENGLQLLAPEGVIHGFVTREPRYRDHLQSNRLLFARMRRRGPLGQLRRGLGPRWRAQTFAKRRGRPRTRRF